MENIENRHVEAQGEPKQEKRVLVDPIVITRKVMIADVKNKNHRIFPLKVVERICQNVNMLTHEIHSGLAEKEYIEHRLDKDGKPTDETFTIKGYDLNGIIVGRTISVNIEDGVLSVTAEIEKSFFEDKDPSEFIISPIGIGAVKNQIVEDYDFSGFCMSTKNLNAFLDKDGNHLY